MNDSSLSQKVKELRNRKGFSQESLAEECGLSLRTIQRIENNESVPRGDTMKRLALALNTSPDEIIDWKIQEDQNYLTLMSLSAIGFLFFPILGIIIPLILWISKKDKLKNVNELGKAILNFQISWTFLLFIYYAFIFITILGGFNSLLSNLKMTMYTLYIPLMIMYLYNIVMILFNAIRVYNKKTFKYKPALNILK